jgi:hypothetical protein
VHVEPGRPAKCTRQGDSLLFKGHFGPAEHSLWGTGHTVVSLFERECRYSTGEGTRLPILPFQVAPEFEVADSGNRELIPTIEENARQDGFKSAKRPQIAARGVLGRGAALG